MRVLGSVMDPGAHGQIICSDSAFSHWNGSIRAEKEKLENVGEKLEGDEKKLSEVFEVRD